KLTENKKILDKVLIQISRIPKDAIKKPIDTDPSSFYDLEVDELKGKQEVYVDSIQTLLDERSGAESSRNKFNSELTTLSSAKPNLESEKNKFEKQFNEARKKLQDETDFKLD